MTRKICCNPTIVWAATWITAVLPGAGVDVMADTNSQDNPVADPDHREVLLNPSHKAHQRQAPNNFQALFRTSAGEFVLEVHRAWAPRGADRFYNLVDNGFYNGCRFFRVVPGFIVQWGIPGDPELSAAWNSRDHPEAAIADDPVLQSNTRGRATFAMAGPNTRTTQLFINYGDNSFLDDPRRVRGSKFSPFGEIISGMEIVDKLNDEYGEPPGSLQGQLQAQGNKYLDQHFPQLDHILEAVILAPEQENPDHSQPAQSQPAD